MQLSKHEVAFMKAANIYSYKFSFVNYKKLKARRADDGSISYRVPMWEDSDRLFTYSGDRADGTPGMVTWANDAHDRRSGCVYTLAQFIKEVKAS